ncbi:MAG: hypothetical protein IKY53_06650 [Lachnospiraceae bacterium]|nr:hypothetical protein [Lachnospiraceae bacterium]
MKNTNKKHNRKRLVIMIPASILLLIVIVIILIPKLLFTDYEGLPTTGPYEVAQASAILIDNNRIESFETDGSKREVPVYFYYPVTETEESCPLILFSHGAFGYYQSNTSTYMELASHGYVVVSLDHPYHSFFTTDTTGKTIIVNSAFIQDVMRVNAETMAEDEIIALSHSWLEVRLADMNFVLDTIKEAKTAGALQPSDWYVTDETVAGDIETILAMTDTQTIGVMGHSLGGASSVTLGRTRDDIDAVIDLDGTMLGEELSYENGTYDFFKGEYPVPLLALSNEEHYLQGEEAGNLYVNHVVLANAKESHYTYFVGSGHMNFTDLPLFSPALASMLGVGEADATECIATMNEIILSYYDFYLKGEGEFVLEESY